MPDLTAKSFAGVRNTLPAERLKPEDLVAAVNVDLDDSGRAARRPGQLTKVAGDIHSLWSDGTTCLYIKDGGMYSLATNFASTLVALGLDADPMAYLAVNGRVYHSNGTQNGILDGGRVRSWGIAIDPIVVHGAATNGALEAGTYLYAMTWLRNDGQESGTGLAARIDLADNAGITFSWNVPGDLAIVSAALYLSQPNGEVLQLAASVDIEAGQYTYTGGARSLPLATQWCDAPPVGQCLAYYRGRIYIAAGAELFATKALGYEWCDLRDFRAFDGSTITLLAAVDSGLFVGTEKALYFLSGAGFEDNALTSKMDAGCVAGSLVVADGCVVTGKPGLAGLRVVLFATTDGIVLGMPDGSLQNLTKERYTFATGFGAAILKQDATQTQYLLSMHT